jgi:hypothetical protein
MKMPDGGCETGSSIVSHLLKQITRNYNDCNLVSGVAKVNGLDAGTYQHQLLTFRSCRLWRHTKPQSYG